MSELVIKTKLKAADVQKRIGDLPKIIAGELPDPLGLRRYFFAIFARRLFELIHEAFRVKATGASDSLGYHWRGLKKKTLRNRLRSSFLNRYPLSLQLLINRVSDRLFDSLAPGTVSSTEYLPPKEQKYLLEAKRLVLGTDVPYAAKVNSLRRLWPARMKRWFQDAVNTALDMTLIRLTKSFA